MLRNTALPFTKRPAWRLPKRPASSATSVVIEWRVPLSEVKQLHEAGLAKAVGFCAFAFSPQKRVFGGVKFGIFLQAKKQADGVLMGAYALVDPLPGVDAQGGLVSASIELEAAQESFRARGFLTQLGSGFRRCI